MRTTINLNENWLFTKEEAPIPRTLPTHWETVQLPHSWNSLDGQDGGSDYHRGTCLYAKTLSTAALPQNCRYYLEINGANSSADLYINAAKLAHHDGGYSTWRVDVTEHLTGDALLTIAVDNAPSDAVYPQMADFTFYGGLYRNVNLICVNASHFALDYHGSPGLAVTPSLAEDAADIRIETRITNAAGDQLLHYQILDADGILICETTLPASETTAFLHIPQVHRWHGRKDPYLYTAVAELLSDGCVLDTVSARFGCRTFRIDPDRGFILNGEDYPLRGVSRHQDRLGLGNALLPEHHLEDMDLICEVGANTIRLAHYQHDQYFYDLCDERGMVVWAEIPYISRHMPGGRENTISQMN